MSLKNAFHRSALLQSATFLASTLVALQGQVFTDGGFENYDVSAGGFVKPASGLWLFANDAGVVEPPSPNSSTGSGNTWSATYAPVEGAQYASTYAGFDTLRQVITFPAVGQYAISVYAASPNGTLTIPGVGTQTLVDGMFAFTFAAQTIGSNNRVPVGEGWQLFSASFTVQTPGNYELGIKNTAAAPYFINYDRFAIQAVPEPASWSLAILGLVLAGCWHKGMHLRRP